MANLSTRRSRTVAPGRAADELEIRHGVRAALGFEPPTSVVKAQWRRERLRRSETSTNLSGGIEINEAAAKDADDRDADDEPRQVRLPPGK